jgi:2-polyprenyl-3-methyl-5-hydroxy-6-metoxy-1,4-benzoquinol methylase
MNTPNLNDPLGQAVFEYYTTKKAKKLKVYSNIVETDEIPVPYLFRTFNQMPPLEQKALKLCRGKVLDVGAAAGPHSLWLKAQNFEVFPIDVSELAVKTMQLQGLTEARQINFFDLKTDNKFDTLLFLMNGIGIAGTLNELPLFFEKCKQLLEPNGQVILDSSDIIYLFGDEKNGYQIDLNADYYGQVTYQMSYGSIKGNQFTWLFIDFNTLLQMARQSGFTCELVLKGSHFDYLARLSQ